MHDIMMMHKRKAQTNLVWVLPGTVAAARCMLRRYRCMFCARPATPAMLAVRS
jgi:hypothetical protein